MEITALIHGSLSYYCLFLDETTLRSLSGDFQDRICKLGAIAIEDNKLLVEEID